MSISRTLTFTLIAVFGLFFLNSGTGRAATVSPDGSILSAGTSGSLVTGAGTWTFSTATGSGGNVILLNGKQAANGSAVELAIDNGGQLYAGNMLGHWYLWNGSGWTVTSSPFGSVVNGQCGTSNGATFSSEPTTDLCTTGTASAITGTGPWNWSCVGSNGGTSASCTAALALSVSPDGSTIHAGSGGSLITTAGVWTFGTATGSGGNVILLNGKQAASGSGIELVVDNGGKLYVNNNVNHWYVWTGSGWSTTVSPLGSQQVNGQCGPTNGTVASEPPMTGLCDVGTASAITGGSSDVWQWSCIGSGGGTTASCSTSKGSGTWWKPVAASEWQWELDHALNLSSAADMGTGITAYSGATSPTTDPAVYDIDGFDNPATTVASLHALGKKVTCYIEVGAAENYRSDYAEFPVAVLGNVLAGYANERYLDIRSPTVVSIIEARIAMCVSKGFDAIEPDIDESYGSSTGFPLTKADEETYMTILADYAHGLGVAMWGKNPDDTGDSYAADMVNVFDAVLTEQCNQYGTCSLLAAYTGKKAVFNAEYKGPTSSFCPADNARAGWMGNLFPVALTGARSPCE